MVRVLASFLRRKCRFLLQRSEATHLVRKHFCTFKWNPCHKGLPQRPSTASCVTCSKNHIYVPWGCHLLSAAGGQREARGSPFQTEMLLKEDGSQMRFACSHLMFRRPTHPYSLGHGAPSSWVQCVQDAGISHYIPRPLSFPGERRQT